MNVLKRSGALLLVALLCGASAILSQDESAERSDLVLTANNVEYTVSVEVPPGWSVAPAMFPNSRTLVDVGVGEARNPSAHVQIHVEPRLDHADALKQMREFGSVVPPQDKVVTTIGEWPAVQVTRLEMRPQPSQGPRHEDPRILRIDTFIAFADALVVVSAGLPSAPTPETIDAALAISSSLLFESTADPDELEEDLELLRLRAPPEIGFDVHRWVAVPEVEVRTAGEGTNARIDAAGRGELEIAVSPDGLNVVVALQGRRWVSSNDGGATFPNSGTVGAGNGDPSIAYGQSGNFYIAYIDNSATCNSGYLNPVVAPDLAPPPGPDPAPFGLDCTGIARSTDNGMSFQTNTVNPAVVCIQRAPTGMVDPANACFPDQEHIAADRVNAGGGGDQVYSTWRNFQSGPTNAGLVCSQDSGVTWTAPISLGANSAFPRITAGQDGFVYVAAYGGGFYRLWKFDSCANGLGLVAGFPKQVVARNPYDCPFAGHDRCDQNPSSQTVAVDDTDPQHIYFAYAEDAGPGSDSNVFVRDSLDGGVTWPAARVVQANAAVAGRRIFPWLCTTSGDAVVTWYEQRDPVPSDTTHHWGARVGLSFFDTLVSKEVFRISEVPDNWCDSGWSCGTRVAPSASESCPIQPQLAGRCGDADPMTPNSNTPCDFSDEAAIPGTYCPQPFVGSGNNETCLGGNGCPKYGDYNGNACAGAKLFAAWPSAASPPGVPGPSTATNSGVLFDVINLDGIEVPVITVPGGVQFADTCSDDPGFDTLEVCNTGNANLQVDVITSDNPDFAVTIPSSGFPVTISPDFCFPFEVTFTPSGAGPASATLTLPTNDPARPSVDVTASGNRGEPQIVTIFDDEYGNVCLGEASTQELRIQNSGDCDLTVNNITSSNAEFDLATVMSFPLVIGPGSEITVPIEFAPAGDTTGESGTISITHDAANTASPKQLTATGTSGDAIINTFLANSGAFGAVCRGDFLDLDLTVQNDGACPLEIDLASIVLGANAQPGDFVLPAGGAAGTVVEPENSVLIPIRFMPSAFDNEPPLTRMASVEVDGHTRFASSALPTDVTPINGVVPPPDIQVAIANSGDFGAVCKGEQGDLDLTLFNQGSCDLTITDIGILPDPDSFELPASLTLPLILSPDASFALPIRFAPDECFEVPEMRTLQITSDDPDEMMVGVALSGVSPCPNLVIDPTGLTGLFAFPATVVDTGGTLGCSSERSLDLRNNGACPLTINSVSAAGADFFVTQPSVFPIVLPGGEETLSVVVRFTPQADADPLAPSEVNGQLTVMTDDPDGAGFAGLCGESVAQSGVRILVTDQSGPEPLPVDPVELIRITSKGIHTPGPISLRYTDQPVSSSVVCGNQVLYHVDQETLPSTDTTGNDPNSSYTAKAKNGNLQTSESFPLGQCEFREFQLQLEDSDSPACELGQKGDPCSTDGECCSGQCTGPDGNKTCK